MSAGSGQMTIVELQDLLDRYGGEPDKWPQALRAEAERLIASERAAQSLAERARFLDAAIARSVATPDAEGARVLAALGARALPRQRHSWWSWPAALREADFAPAWPRIAALAGAAALGFALGLAGLDPRDGSISMAAMSGTDTGLSVVAFEPEPLTGVRP
jgi:hypothetical protein